MERSVSIFTEGFVPEDHLISAMQQLVSSAVTRFGLNLDSLEGITIFGEYHRGISEFKTGFENNDGLSASNDSAVGVGMTPLVLRMEFFEAMSFSRDKLPNKLARQIAQDIRQRRAMQLFMSLPIVMTIKILPTGSPRSCWTSPQGGTYLILVAGQLGANTTPVAQWQENALKCSWIWRNS
jgi:hypothetical protein